MVTEKKVEAAVSPKKQKMSKVSVSHYVKLVLRSLIFITTLVLYIVHRVFGEGDFLMSFKTNGWWLGFVWVFYMIEMITRLFPSKLESPGCQKQFKSNFVPTGETKPKLMSWKRTLVVLSSWVALNGAIGALYFFNVIDTGILFVISTAYGVCDMICILFFCPFQTWMMKNRCCSDCRIYNWDFIMMFTPCIFMPSLYTWTLFGLSAIILARWEITYKLHPERFSTKTNGCISCHNCTEKLCHHKKQLHGYWKRNKDVLNNK